jgi:hypothetical protein
MKFLLLFFPALLMLAGCKKDAPFQDEYPKTIRVQIVEKGRGTGVPFATVGVIKRTGDFLYPIYSILEQKQADTNGFAEFVLKEWGLSLAATQWNYFASNYVGVETVDFKKSSKIELLPYAYLTLRIRNVAPYNNIDRISVGNSFGYPRPTQTAFSGDHVDTTITGTIAGGMSQKAVWFVTKNGIETTYQSNPFQVLGGDTFYYEINY